MRLITTDLRPVYVFKREKTDESSCEFYPGTEGEDRYTGTVMCNIQPVSNRILAEIYGKRISEMKSMICDLDAEISDENRVAFVQGEKPTHKIISIMEYSTHKTLLAERII